MTIEVKNNHFFTKYYPTVTAPILEDFPDLPLSGGSTFDLESYDTNTSVLLSSSTNPPVTYGDYELVGGYLRTYMSDISLGSQTSMPPYFGVYKLKDEWPITQGGFTIATNGSDRVGQKMRLLQSTNMGGDNILYQENFDGESKNLKISGNPLTSEPGFKRKRYTMSLSKLASIKGWEESEGAAGSINSTVIAVPAQHANLRKFVEAEKAAWTAAQKAAYESSGAPSYGSKNVDVYKWHPGGIIVGFVPKNGSTWRAAVDTSVQLGNTDIINHAVYVQAYYGQYGGGSTSEAAEMNVGAGISDLASSIQDAGRETGIEAETNNTILSAFKQSLNFENPWSATDTSTLLVSEVKLTEGQGKDGSKALELYHLWGMADEYKDVNSTSMTETLLGVSGNINPQVVMAGMWNIPIPTILDNGRDITDDSSSGSTKYVTVPEISLDVKIAKLEPSPLYGVEANPTYYGKQITGSEQSIRVAYGWKSIDLGGSASTNMTSLAGSIDNGMQIMNTGPGNKMDSLLRSFTICFSNYKPLSNHNTLDEFLAYGLSNFYGSGASMEYGDASYFPGGTAPGRDKARGIVGGITFRRQITNDAASTTTLIAEALPVTRNYDSFSPRSASVYNPYPKLNGWKPTCDAANLDTATSMTVVALRRPIPSGTVITFPDARTFTLTGNASQGNTGINGTRGGTGTIPSGTQATVKLQDDITIAGDISFYGMGILDGGSPNVPRNRMTLGNSNYSRNFNTSKKVEIPTNSYFNLRFFTDVSQKTSVFSQTRMPYIRFPGGSSGEGVSMRCIIDTDETAPDADNDTGSEDMLFIDIPFPVGLLSGASDSIEYPGLNEGGETSGGDGNANGPWSVANNPDLFPRYMTMWLQNYRWCSERDGDSVWWEYGDNNALTNKPDGATMEAQVFVDNITLKNFTPNITDATSTNYSRGIVDMKPGTVQTPLTLITGQSGGGSAGDILMNAFSSDDDGHTYTATLTGTTGILPSDTTANLVDVAPGSYILMGFENKDDVPQRHTTTELGTFSGSPGAGDAARVSGPYNDVAPTSTDGSGTGLKFDIVVTTELGLGVPYFTLVSGGSGVAVDDTFTFAGSTIGGGADVVLTATGLESQGQYGYWMMNNFWSNNFTDLSGSSYSVDLADSGYLRDKAVLNMGYTNTGGTGMSKGKFLGLQLFSELVAASGTPTFYDSIKGSEFDIVSADAAIDPTNADAQMKMILPTGANDIYSADGFTQKGFGYLSVTGTSTTAPSYTSWGKREHILASTKIVGVAGVSSADPWGGSAIENDRTIRVADPDIIAAHNDDTFLIYRIYGDGTATTHVKGVASPLKLESPNSIMGNLVTFNESVLLADDGSTKLCTEDLLSELYICPYKYWVMIGLDSGAEKVPRSYGQWVFVNETPATGSIATQTGSTYNESPYYYDTAASFVAGNQGKSALYQNLWTLLPGDMTSAIQTDIDYGFGVVEHVDGTSTTYSPTTGIALGVIDTQPAKIDSYIDYGLHALVAGGAIAEGVEQHFGMLLAPLDSTNTKKATFYTSDNADATKTPRFYWNYYDAVPLKPVLAISPAVELIPSGHAPSKENIDLYNITSENLNAVRFDWDEQDSDIWYRYILTGAGAGVNNKYMGAKWYAPLNEVPTDQNLGTAPTYKIYDEVLNVSEDITNGGVVLSDLNGLSGWTAVFPGTGSTSFLSIAFADNNFPSGSAGEWSIVTHCIPASDAADGDDLQWIAYRGSEGYRVGITGCTGSSPAVFVSGAGVTMTGTSTIPFDAVTPLSIIATFRSGSNVGPDANLYVNGVKEDFVNTATTLPDSTDDSYIGSIGATNRFRGSIEEVIIYNQELIVPTQANEWVYSTADTPDTDSDDKIVTHTARLFLFDYHNIRGKTPSLVCQSNDCVWRTTV